MRFKEFLQEVEAKEGLIFIVVSDDMKASYLDKDAFPMTHVTKGSVGKVKKIENGMVFWNPLHNAEEDIDPIITPVEDFERDTKSKRDYDRDFLLGLKESVVVKKGHAYEVTASVMFANEILPDGELWRTEIGPGSLVRVTDVTDSEVHFKFVRDDLNEFKYVMAKDKFIRDTEPSAFDRDWMNSLKEAVMLRVGGKYMMTRPLPCIMLMGEPAKFYYDDVPLTVSKLGDEWTTVSTPDGWTVQVKTNLLSRNVIPERDYHMQFFNDLKEQQLTEMPAKAGEGPRAILAKIWKEETAKELDKMPMYKKHTTSGYRRKAKDEMVKMELHQFFKLGDLRDLVGIKDQRGRKHDVKALDISWFRPTAWRGDGGIFKTKADYMKMIPIMQEVFQRFIARVKESGLNIIGYATRYSDRKEMASFSAFDIEGDLRGESGTIELYFEESDALLRKGEIRDKIYRILQNTQVFKRDLVKNAAYIEEKKGYFYRSRRAPRESDEAITLIPASVIDDLRYFAGDAQGEQHMLSLVDPSSESGKAVQAKLDAMREKRLADLPSKINRSKELLEKMLAQTNGQIENVKSYSPYEIKISIGKPSSDSAEWLFRAITGVDDRDNSKPWRDESAFPHQWVKNAEWLFIRIGDRKSVHPDGVEQVDQ